MSDGSELILGIVFIVVLLSIALAWAIDRRSSRVVIDEPYGDASDTPNMIHNTRRVNHKVAND